VTSLSAIAALAAASGGADAWVRSQHAFAELLIASIIAARAPAAPVVSGSPRR
jgi:hypothetical protein